MRWSFLQFVVVLLGVLGLAADVLAGDTSEVSLHYTRGPGASECIDEAQLRQEVAARLGSSPFDPKAHRSVRVSVSAVEGQGLQARIVVETPGQPARVRQLADPDTSCRELGEAVVFAVSVAIDPGRALAGGDPAGGDQAGGDPAGGDPADRERESRDPRPIDAAATLEAAHTARIDATQQAIEQADAAAKALPEPSVKPASSSLAPDTIRGFAGGGVVLGSTPGTVGSFSLGAEFGWGGFSVQPGLRVDLPGTEVAGTEAARRARVEATITMGELSGCGRIEPVLACAVLAAGVIRGSGVGLDENRKVSAFHAAAGARLGADLRLYGPLSLRLQGEVLTPLNRTTLAVNGEAVWQTPVLSAQLGALVVLRLF